MKFFNSAKQDDEVLYVTFDTTTNAFSFKARAMSAGLKGQLVMIPRSLSADCGMSWRESLTNEVKLLEVIRAEGDGCNGPFRV